MRPSPLMLTAMLAAFLMAGCSEDIATVPDQESYQQTTTNSYSTVPSSNQGLYNPIADVATGSSTASATPGTGAGVQAVVSSSQARGLFKKTLELTVQVSNHDTVAHAGYLVATFKDSAGKTELAYRYLTITPNGLETLTINSTNPATSGSVVFKERFL